MLYSLTQEREYETPEGGVPRSRPPKPLFLLCNQTRSRLNHLFIARKIRIFGTLSTLFFNPSFSLLCRRRRLYSYKVSKVRIILTNEQPTILPMISSLYVRRFLILVLC